MKWILLTLTYGISILAQGNTQCDPINIVWNDRRGEWECPNKIPSLPKESKPFPGHDSKLTLPKPPGVYGIPSVVRGVVRGTDSQPPLLRLGGVSPTDPTGDTFSDNELKINLQASKEFIKLACSKLLIKNKMENDFIMSESGECPLPEDQQQKYYNLVSNYCKGLPGNKASKDKGVIYGKITGKDVNIQKGACVFGNVKFKDNTVIPDGTIIINFGKEVFDFYAHSEAEVKHRIYSPIDKNAQDKILNSSIEIISSGNPSSTSKPSPRNLK